MKRITVIFKQFQNVTIHLNTDINFISFSFSFAPIIKIRSFPLLMERVNQFRLLPHNMEMNTKTVFKIFVLCVENVIRKQYKQNKRQTNMEEQEKNKWKVKISTKKINFYYLFFFCYFVSSFSSFSFSSFFFNFFNFTWFHLFIFSLQFLHLFCCTYA